MAGIGWEMELNAAKFGSFFRVVDRLEEAEKICEDTVVNEVGEKQSKRPRNVLKRSCEESVAGGAALSLAGNLLNTGR